MIDAMTLDPARQDLLILVDPLDCPNGSASKEEVHRKGLLHRAFSVILTRHTEDIPELLLAKRATTKYHAPGLWANSCCSHPRQGETLIAAAHRRLFEELQCDAESLHEIGHFVYRSVFPDGIIEYEYDHILIGSLKGTPSPSPLESEEIRWVTPDRLSLELVTTPELFAPWAFNVLSAGMEWYRTSISKRS